MLFMQTRPAMRRGGGGVAGGSSASHAAASSLSSVKTGKTKKSATRTVVHAKKGERPAFAVPAAVRAPSTTSTPMPTSAAAPTSTASSSAGGKFVASSKLSSSSGSGGASGHVGLTVAIRNGRVVVNAIRKNSPAAQCQRIQVGDEILRVGDVKMSSAAGAQQLTAVTAAFVSAGGSAELTLRNATGEKYKIQLSARGVVSADEKEGASPSATIMATTATATTNASASSSSLSSSAGNKRKADDGESESPNNSNSNKKAAVVGNNKTGDAGAAPASAVLKRKTSEELVPKPKPGLLATPSQAEGSSKRSRTSSNGAGAGILPNPSPQQQQQQQPQPQQQKSILPSPAPLAPLVPDGAMFAKSLALQGGAVLKSSDKIYSVDCEMVECRFPNGERKSALARACVVDVHGRQIWHKFIKPTHPITDYRTRWSGVRASDLIGAIPEPFAQQELRKVLEGATVVGHALSNDFNVIGYTPPEHMTRDTSMYLPLRKGMPVGVTPSLKKLAEKHLRRGIQSGEHNPAEDALAALHIYLKYRISWERSLLTPKEDVVA